MLFKKKHMNRVILMAGLVLSIASLATGVMIQSVHANDDGTTFIDATGGECTTVGSWDDTNKICTFTTDVSEPVVISNNGITLDCDGHTIQATGADVGVGVGVDVSVNDSTVKNCTILNFATGIFVGGNGNTIMDNTTQLNTVGISGWAPDNSITGNKADHNQRGIDSRGGNTLEGKTANHNGDLGFLINGDNGNNNSLIDNSANHNGKHGIALSDNYHDLIGNTANHNVRAGINLPSGDNNEFVDNTANRNGESGFFIGVSSYDNEFDNNQASHNGEYGYEDYGDNDFSSDNNKCVKNLIAGSISGNLCSPQS